jgi:hypothetical protein
MKEPKQKRWVKWLELDQEWRDFILDVNLTFVDTLAVILITSLLGVMAFNILSQPGGLAGLLAGVLGQTCSVTGLCDFDLLYGALGLAVVLLTTFTTYTMLLIRSGVRKIDYDPPASKGCREYEGNQDLALRIIQAMGSLESVAQLGNFLDVPYGTIHRWIQQMEQDGHVRIVSNGSGSPLRIEAK